MIRCKRAELIPPKSNAQICKKPVSGLAKTLPSKETSSLNPLQWLELRRMFLESAQNVQEHGSGLGMTADGRGTLLQDGFSWRTDEEPDGSLEVLHQFPCKTAEWNGKNGEKERGGRMEGKEKEEYLHKLIEMGMFRGEERPQIKGIVGRVLDVVSEKVVWWVEWKKDPAFRTNIVTDEFLKGSFIYQQEMIDYFTAATPELPCLNWDDENNEEEKEASSSETMCDIIETTCETPKEKIKESSLSASGEQQHPARHFALTENLLFVEKEDASEWIEEAADIVLIDLTALEEEPQPKPITSDCIDFPDLSFDDVISSSNSPCESCEWADLDNVNCGSDLFPPEPLCPTSASSATSGIAILNFPETDPDMPLVSSPDDSQNMTEPEICCTETCNFEEDEDMLNFLVDDAPVDEEMITETVEYDLELYNNVFPCLTLSENNETVGENCRQSGRPSEFAAAVPV